MDVWADESALYIWSGEERADLAPIKAAKAALNVDRVVKPVGVTSIEQLPSLDTRVLAVGSRPPFLCEYALTSERTSPEGWQRALSWVLGITVDDPKATTVLDILTSTFGPGMKEISAEELAAEEKMAAYQQGRE